MITIRNRVVNFDFKTWLRKNWKVIVFLVLLVCLAYGNSLKGDFVSDDTRSILNNSMLDGKIGNIFKDPPEFLRPLLYYTLTKTFGRVPLFYRLINILFHSGTVLVVYLLISILVGSRVAFFSAAILAVHPIESEAVSWITGGVYSQYSFFLVLSFLFFILSLKDSKFSLISFITFIFALLSSAQSMILPLLIFLFAVSFGQLGKTWKRLLLFFAIDGIWLIIYLFKFTHRVTQLQTAFYSKPQFYNSLIQIPIAITSYFQLIFWPSELTLYHSEMVFARPEYIIRLIIFLIFLGIVIHSFKRNRFIFFFLSFFIISLLPFLTPFGISWIVAERYVYLGSIGIFVIVALGLEKLGKIKRLKIPVNLLFFLIISALLLRTFLRNIDWRNEDNLWIATAKTSPSSPNTHNNLGDVYSRWGDLEKAALEFKKAIQIKPGYADAYHNLAHTYQKMGKLKEAVTNYQQAIHYNPNLWQSYQNLAGLYLQQNNLELARENLEMAVKINPNSPNLRSNLGVIYFKTGEKIKAKEEFQKALSLDPNEEMARKALSLMSSS